MESHLIILNLETIPIGRQATNNSKSQVHEEAQAGINHPILQLALIRSPFGTRLMGERTKLLFLY
jgi:hypothetical protein